MNRYENPQTYTGYMSNSIQKWVYWLLAGLIVMATAIIPLTNSNTAGAQVPAPLTGLDLSMKANMTLSQEGQVKESPGKMEIRDRQYQGVGAYPIVINGSTVVASQLTMTTGLKFKNGIGEHKGAIDIVVGAAGRITLEYSGTATREIDPLDGDIEIVSGGTFKAKRAASLWAGLLASGTYAMKINERDGKLGAKVTVSIATVGPALADTSAATLPSSAIIGGPFEGVSGPGYPTGPLDMSMKADLTFSNLGQVKGLGDKQEVKDRKYEGTGQYKVTINGAPLTASQVTVISNLKFNGETADHQGRIDLEVNAPAAGHVTLEYHGTARQGVDPTEGDIILTSGGLFKTKKMSGIWADLVSNGTYSMRINEREGTAGKNVTITIETVSSLSAAAIAGGPFEGVSGPGYPTGPLNMDTGTITPLLNRVGQVKAQGDKLEIKDRQYEAAGSLPVTINGTNFTASEIKVISNLKASAGNGQHQGTIDVDIDILPGGHVTLEYRGTATISGSTITSAGTFKTRKTTGMFAGLVADGTYDMTIVESGVTEGSMATVTISTRSSFSPLASAGWDMAVTRAQFDGAQLHLEVRDAEPNSRITVDGVVVGTASAQGKFRTQIQGFTLPASGQITVSDGIDTRVVTVIVKGSQAAATTGGREKVSFQMTDTGLLPGATGQGTIELRKDKTPGQLSLSVSAEGTSRRSGTETTGVLNGATYSLCLNGRVMASAEAAENLLGVIVVTLSARVETTLGTINGSIVRVADGTNCARAVLETAIALSDADLGWDMAVTRAQFSGVLLRLEVRDAEPNSTIKVNDVAVGTADTKGMFRTELPGFTPPASCQITVSDPFDTRVVTLEPCVQASGGGAGNVTAGQGGSVTLQLTPAVAGASGTAVLGLRIDEGLGATVGGPELQISVTANGLAGNRFVALCVTGPDGVTLLADVADDRKESEASVSLKQKLKVAFTSLSGVQLKLTNSYEGTTCTGVTLLHGTVLPNTGAATAAGGEPNAGWDMAVTRAEFDGVILRLEVRDAEPNSTIKVDGVAVGTADTKGSFRTEVAGFKPPASCQITVSDPFDTRVVTLKPCVLASSGTATTPPPPAPPPPPASQPSSGGAGGSALPGGGAISSLSMSIPVAQLILDRLGSVKEQGGQIVEIKDRKYQGLGSFAVTLNGIGQTAGEISINSTLTKVQNGAGDHQGTMVIRVAGVGNLDLAFKGSAQISGNTITSQGTFKMTKAGDNFMGLAAAEGTYNVRITETGSSQGSPANVGLSLATR